jgi:tropinone reductase I
MWNLKDKTVLITGGTKGIGKATVIEMLKLGASVLFTARHSAEVVALEKELKSTYPAVSGLTLDVTNETDRQQLSDWIGECWGRLDVLVNNAGTNVRKPSDEYSKEEYNRVMDTDLHAPFQITIAMLPYLKKSSAASIINIASVAGMMDVRTGSPYGMAKAGLLQLTRNLAVEFADSKIRVNSVSPWFTETPLTEGLRANQEKLQKVLDRTPLKRVARPDEIASVISFLAMDKSSYLTAQNIVVDGGMMANAL